MFKRSIYAAAVVAFVSVVTTGCGSSGSTGTGGGAGGSGGGSADPELTCDAMTPATPLSKVFADILTPDCVSCHKVGGTGEAYGNYSTEALAFGQVGKKSLFAGAPDTTLKAVEANSLGTSTMWLKVLARDKSPLGRAVGTPMPQSAAALTAAQKKTLKDWICSGAKM